MKKPGIITIDIGTTSTRAVLFDSAGIQVFLSRRDSQPTYHPDGRVEQPAESWAALLPSLLSDCAASARSNDLEPVCIALTSLRSSVIPVDREGKALHPAIMWQDLRTEALCRDMAAHNAEVYGICGMKITPVMSAVKMRWFREQTPDLFRRTWKMVGIHDSVLRTLTGRFVTDPSLASRTNLLNLGTLDWDEDLIALFGLSRSLLCDMIPPGSVAGGLVPSMAADTGLPAGLPVVSAGGDQQCAALGLGLTSPDRIVANTGTGSYLLAYSARPVFDSEMRVFCNAAAVPGAYVVEAGLPASGVIYRWFGEHIYEGAKDQGCAQVDYDLVNAEAAASPPGAGGLIFLPHFKGSGAPHFNPLAKGTFHNLDLNTTRGDLGRAILEGIAAEMADNLELLETLTQGVDWVNSSGGLSKFGLFNRIQADMYERKVRRAEHGEATALGAWISAAKAIGLYGSLAEAFAAAAAGSPTEEYLPDSASVEFYGRLRAARRALYDSLYPA